MDDGVLSMFLLKFNHKKYTKSMLNSYVIVTVYLQLDQNVSHMVLSHRQRGDDG